MNGLFDIFNEHVKCSPDKDVFIFLEDGESMEEAVTYEELFTASVRYAASLAGKEYYQRSVLLLFPPGIEYVKAFMACLTAGVIAVPMYPPRSSKHSERLVHIIDDCNAAAILTTEKYREKLKSFESEKVDACPVYTLADLETEDLLDYRSYQEKENIALIQYTSGSTGSPKGVMVTNENILANEEQMRVAMRQSASSVIVSWLPMYHDMGLIGNILHNIYIGSTCVFFAPVQFLQRPLRWLKAISKYKATFSGAPNFAYDLLNELDIEGEDIDLSSLEILFNGSEKVRLDTISTFCQKYKAYGLGDNVMYPCYGMAEATLMVSGNDKGVAYTSVRTTKEAIKKGVVRQDAAGNVDLVSAGKVRGGMETLILKNVGQPCEPGEIGEICLSGKNIAGGYWGGRSPESFFEHEGAQYIRTGDLGTLIEGQLYITGRKKEIIIINGVNYYPYDIERQVSEAHHGLVMNGCAAFSADDGKKERLVVVAEIKRTYYRELDENEVFAAINDHLGKELSFLPDDILLIKPMSLPKTSSGKIRRSYCARLYQEGGFDPICSLADKKAEVGSEGVVRFEDALMQKVYEAACRAMGEALDMKESDHIHETGLDSLRFMEFLTSLEKEFGIDLPIHKVYEDITYADLCGIILEAGHTPARDVAAGAISANQEALWLGSQNDLSRNSIGFSFGLQGSISVAVIEDALDKAFQSLQVTGGNFLAEEGRITFVPSDTLYETTLLSYTEYSAQKLETLYNAAWELQEQPLIRLYIFRDEEAGKNHITLICHHIIADGWSLALLFERWVRALNGEVLPANGQPYRTLIAEEANTLQNAGLVEKAKTHLQESVLSKTVNATYAGHHREEPAWEQMMVALDRQLVNEAARQMNVTPYLLLLGAYHIALRFLSSGRRICSVTPLGRRNTARREHMFGYVVNLAYIASEFEPGETQQAYFDRLRSAYRKALEYQEVPYAQIIRDVLAGEEQMKALGLYYFAYQSFESDEFIELFSGQEKCIKELTDGSRLYATAGYNPGGNFRLELEVFELPEQLTGYVKYDRKQFSGTFVQELLGFMNYFIGQAAPAHSIGATMDTWDFRTPAICQGDAKELPATHFLHQFDKMVQKHPERPALLKEKEVLTYAELDIRAGKVAAALQGLYHVEKDEPVLLLNQRGVGDLVALIGIMKAGAVYTPVEKDLPQERLLQIAKNTGARCMIGAPDYEIPGLTVADADTLMAYSETACTEVHSAYAYIIHTSGSSGVPKGVRIQQSALVNLNETMKDRYGLTEQDRVLQFALLSFDMSVEEIFPVLSAGGAVVLRAPDIHESLTDFVAYCRIMEVSVLNLPTSYWNELTALAELPPAVRIVAVGGEKMNLDNARSWFERFGREVALFNAYGPTEYTVNAAIKQLAAEGLEHVAVGTPVHNTAITIRNTDGYTLPAGIMGEVTLSGTGMAEGYLHGDGENAFVTYDGTPHYHTGDLGYIDSNHEVVITGRKDNQTKLRGYRVELEEIDHYLTGAAGVETGICLVRDQVLYAFAVPATGIEVREEDIKEELRRHLPAYMIPQRIFSMERLPLTPRGKLDVRQLDTYISRIGASMEKPSTEMEKLIAALWQEVLEVKETGVTASFFDIGGNSIKAIRLLSRMEKTSGAHIGMKRFYQMPTIREQARYIEALSWIEDTVQSEEQDELII